MLLSQTVQVMDKSGQVVGTVRKRLSLLCSILMRMCYRVSTCSASSKKRKPPTEKEKQKFLQTERSRRERRSCESREEYTLSQTQRLRLLQDDLHIPDSITNIELRGNHSTDTRQVQNNGLPLWLLSPSHRYDARKQPQSLPQYRHHPNTTLPRRPTSTRPKTPLKKPTSNSRHPSHKDGTVSNRTSTWISHTANSPQTFGTGP